MIEPPEPKNVSDYSQLVFDSLKLKREVWCDSAMTKRELQGRIDEISEIAKVGDTQ